MRVAKKNRLQLSQTEQKDANKFDSLTLADRRSRLRFRVFLGLLCVLFLILLGGGIYYYLRQEEDNFLIGSEPKGSSLLERLFPNKEQPVKPEYRYYMPEGALSPKLRQAIKHYQAKELRQASTLFEEIINGPTADKEKAIALIYLGVIAMGRDRYELARHQFLRALRYKPQSIGALVNLAILENLLNNYSASREYALQARKLAPQDKQVLLLLGNVLLEAQDADKAISTYEQALSGLPEDALIYYNLGLSHLQKGNLESALASFKKAIRKSSANKTLQVRAQAHLGQLYLGKGDLNLAVDHLSKAVHLAPENAKYLYNLGVIYLYKKEPRQALLYFKRALEAGEGSPQIYRSLSEAFHRIKQPELAMDALRRALYINPGDLPALFQLGDLEHRTGDLEQAAASFRKIVNITPGDKNTQAALRKLALVYLDMERHNSAIDVLERAIGLQAANPQAYLLLGNIYEKSGQLELAIAAWKKALHPQSSGLDFVLERKEERKIRLALGAAYRRAGAFEQALQQYQLVKERNEESPPLADPYLYLEWARSYAAAKDFRAAVPLFKHVSTLKAASGQERKKAFVELAQSYAKISQNAEYMEAALNNINKALRLDPEDSQSRLTQASLLIQSKTAINREKALEVLKALSNSENNTVVLGQAYNLMGLAYMKNGEYRQALNAFNYALQLDPSNRKAYRNQQAASNAYEKDL